MLPEHDVVALTQALVRMDTINPPGNEDQCTKFLGELLKKAGYECHYTEFSSRRTTLVARLGHSADRPSLCFTGHVDVVPLGSAPWLYAPFDAEIVDGRMYGRGTSDMKSGVAAFTVAAIKLADRIKDSAGVTLVITAGEETGCEGAFHLAALQNVKQIMGTAAALVVAEPTANVPMLGHKGAFWLEASATGVTAHGSMPDRGDNAIYKIARAVSTLADYAFEHGPHPMMGKPTLNVGTVRGGLNINSVPDAAEISIDIRTVAGQRHPEIRQHLHRCLGEEIQIRTLLDVGSVFTPSDDPWMQRVIEICQKYSSLPLQPKTLSYFTDAAALLAPLGNPPVVILGPGEPHMAHQTNEYCEIARLHEAEQIFSDLILDWCAA